MTKLISGRVAKVPSANVSADRYEFLDISQAEPDLGLPPVSGYVLAANTNGTRFWTDPTPAAAGAAQFAYIAGSANVSILANVANTVLTISNFTTANLVEGINLYFTNARVVSAVTPLLTTANVIETSGNLYFTAARVNATVQPFLTTANVIEASSNLYFTTTRVTATVQPLLTTANVVESAGYLYFTAARVNATVQPFLTTANVIETSGNLYFTNARVVSALIAGQNIIIESNGRISANVSSVSLTTDQVPEGVNNKYFTNARVLVGVTTGTIAGSLNLTGNITGANNIIVGSGAGGYISGVQTLHSNAIYANSITVGSEVGGYISGVQAIYSNVIYANALIINGNEVFSSEQGSNITVTRITANIWNGLYTANVIESPTKLFFTNARVVSALIAGQNITIEANGRISANASSGASLNLTTADVRETSNLYFTNTRVVSALIAGQNITIEANGRISANASSGATLNLTTADVRETSNLYFTNARVVSALIAGQNITIEANGRISANASSGATLNLTTADVRETSNLYFTNTRVLVGITTGTVVGNITATGKITADTIAANSINVGSGVGGSITDANLISATFIQANSWLGLYTANVVESPTNLFFTNARVVSALIAGQNITIEANGRISANATTAGTLNLTTADVRETSNLYFTNARVIPAVTPLLTTANVIESTDNLYYTNSRVRTALSNSTGVYYNSSTGTFSIGQDVSQSADVIFKDLTLNGNLFLLGNLVSVFANTLTIADPIIQLGYGNPGDAYDLGWVGHYTTGGTERHTGFFRDRTDGKFKIFDNLTTEPGLTEIDTGNISFRYASVVASTFEGNVLGFVTGQVSSLDNFNTNALKEGGNLYFTTERVNATVQPFLTTANVIELTNQYFTNVRVLQAVTPLLTTSNVAEGSNLYFTAARVNATVQPFLTTANVIETSGNLYFTSARVNATVQPFLTTANVVETSGNLYFTNARVVSALIAGQNITIEANGRISANAATAAALNLTTADVRETSNLYFTVERVNATVQPFLTTANVIETSANLYFTNTRAVSAFTAGKGIVIQENGLIKTATAPAEYNLYIDGSSYGNVLSTMSTMVTMPSATAGDRFIIRSIHVTNISDTTDALLSGNVLYATGNTAMLVNQIPIPVGGVVDLMKRGQLLSPGDKINLQGFTSAGTATANLLSAMFTYETLAADSSYIGVGQTLATSNTNILVYDSDQAASIIESIKIVNLRNSIIPVKLYWGDANGLVKTHLAHNLAVPNNSSIELLINPKRIEKTDRLYASYRNAENNSISVFISARLTATFALSNYDANVIPGSSPLISIATTEAEGTILYYSIE